jgi:hypothetical protein
MKEKRTLFKSENSFGTTKRKASPTPEQQAKRTKSCQNSVITDTNNFCSIPYNLEAVKGNKSDCASTLNGAKKKHLHRRSQRARRHVLGFLSDYPARTESEYRKAGFHPVYPVPKEAKRGRFAYRSSMSLSSTPSSSARIGKAGPAFESSLFVWTESCSVEKPPITHPDETGYR